MNCDVIIIGAGITGIGAAYHLRAANIAYTILEAHADVGGVWNTHRWHGARCDSDFIKYSFSFKPFLSGQCLQSREQIQAYLRAVAEEFSIIGHIRFNTRVTKAVFDTGTQLWTVHTSRGPLTARFLLNGNGYFSEEPHVPAFKDRHLFKGEIIHTSHLDSSRTFAGKRVVLVGSGATAICCAPELARVSQSLVLLQRSPSYIYEISNRAGPLIQFCQWLYRLGMRFPVRWLRNYLQLRDDLVFVGFRRFPGLARRFFRNHWRNAVSEESLRAHFSPRYDPWHQRIAVAIGLKDRLRSGEISIKTAEIERFTESSIVLAGGEELACDACILATGLNLRFFSFELQIGDRKVDVERINLHKGVMLGGVPNYFHPMGSWHSAWTQRLEPVTRLAIRIITHMKKHGLGTVSVPRRELEAAPGITPNYVKRSLATMPRLDGHFEPPVHRQLLRDPIQSARLSVFPSKALTGHRQAARHADHLAGDEAGLVGGEERDDAGDVVGLADALHRDGAHQRVVDLLPGVALAEEAAQDRRVGRSGADHVDRDAFARQLARQRLREGDDAALAGRVHRLAGGADARRVGGDVDHSARAAGKHLRHHEVVHVQRPAQVDVDQRVPFLGLGLDEVLEAVPAGIVHQNVDVVCLRAAFRASAYREISKTSAVRLSPCARRARRPRGSGPRPRPSSSRGKAPADRRCRWRRRRR